MGDGIAGTQTAGLVALRGEVRRRRRGASAQDDRGEHQCDQRGFHWAKSIAVKPHSEARSRLSVDYTEGCADGCADGSGLFAGLWEAAGFSGAAEGSAVGAGE